MRLAGITLPGTRLRAPRLLPLTITAMTALLGVKCTGLVLAAAPAMPATSSQPAPTPVAPPVAAAEKKPDGVAAAALPAAPAPMPSEAERRVLLDLRKRHDELDAREAAMRTQASVLAAAGQKLDQRVGELKSLQTRLEQLDAERRQREDRDWQGLVTVYEKMKPREAARIFDDMEMPVLVKLVDRMKEAKAAAILAAMRPDKARETTTELAAMRQRRDAEAPEAKQEGSPDADR